MYWFFIGAALLVLTGFVLGFWAGVALMFYIDIKTRKETQSHESNKDRALPVR